MNHTSTLKIQANTYTYMLLLLLFFTNTAVYAQEQSQQISKQIYLTSNTGFTNDTTSQQVLQAIVEASQNDEEAALLIMGNITPKKGFPLEKNESEREKVKQVLRDNLLDPLEEFNGQLIFGPGVNEWNKLGHENIDDLESFLQDTVESDFWPDDGCATENEELSDEVELIMVDSQWFLEDWDDHPYINNKCDIKTREQFFLEFKDDIKDAQGKTVIIAVHHPL